MQQRRGASLERRVTIGFESANCDQDLIGWSREEQLRSKPRASLRGLALCIIQGPGRLKFDIEEPRKWARSDL